jgi:hypothetical protein
MSALELGTASLLAQGAECLLWHFDARGSEWAVIYSRTWARPNDANLVALQQAHEVLALGALHDLLRWLQLPRPDDGLDRRLTQIRIHTFVAAAFTQAAMKTRAMVTFEHPTIG